MEIRPTDGGLAVTCSSPPSFFAKGASSLRHAATGRLVKRGIFVSVESIRSAWMPDASATLDGASRSMTASDSSTVDTFAPVLSALKRISSGRRWISPLRRSSTAASQRPGSDFSRASSRASPCDTLPLAGSEWPSILRMPTCADWVVSISASIAFTRSTAASAALNSRAVDVVALGLGERLFRSRRARGRRRRVGSWRR